MNGSIYLYIFNNLPGGEDWLKEEPGLEKVSDPYCNLEEQHL